MVWNKSLSFTALVLLYLLKSSILWAGLEPISGKKLSYFIDSNNVENEDVFNRSVFSSIDDEVPNFSFNSNPVWIHVPAQLVENKEVLLVNTPYLDECSLYFVLDGVLIDVKHFGEKFPFKERDFQNPNFTFDLRNKELRDCQLFLRVWNVEPLIIPITTGVVDDLLDFYQRDAMYNTFFTGGILIMLLLNLVMFGFFRKPVYISYAVYLGFTMLTQVGIKGYLFQYLWPSAPGFQLYSLGLFASLAGIGGATYIYYFLNLKTKGRVIRNGAWVFVGLFSFSIVLMFLKDYASGFKLMHLSTSFYIMYGFIVAISGVRKNESVAKIFLVGWLVLLIGSLVFILKDFGLLPQNELTNYAVQIGSCFEMMIFTIAMGYRTLDAFRVKEQAQNDLLQSIQSNETLIREQNIVLEQTVAERTKELQSSNEQLQTIYENLKEAKSKMSTLGQLTAGIAHDINNPLSYIAMSLEPLAEEIKRLESKIDKEEYSGMVQLVGGVQNSTSRILEIVQRLRDYTRTEKQKTESINLNEVIENSLGLLDYNLRGIEVKKDLNAIPLVVANYGRMNQLFLNLFTNNIEAIREKQETGGVLTIKTESMDQKVQVTITDNGVGMSEETIKHIFDPFYTTKTGGTGLGMVEVKEILDEVGAEVEFRSYGDGSQIRIFLMAV